jgi:hypothetical protein
VRRFPFFILVLTFLAMLLLAQPIGAQDVRVGDAWQQVYQKLPDFPRENQYISRESGKVAESNTLIGRLIRYHVYVKSRPVNFRLDWKLTLADYLGANERIPAATYPSADTLRTSPLQGDVAAIRSLDRTQRDALVQALVDVFTPKNNEGSTPAVTPTPQAPASPPEITPVAPQREPRPGDAQLLLP